MNKKPMINREIHVFGNIQVLLDTRSELKI